MSILLSMMMNSFIKGSHYVIDHIDMFKKLYDRNFLWPLDVLGKIQVRSRDQQLRINYG
jgi:hypothetical protein